MPAGALTAALDVRAAARSGARRAPVDVLDRLARLVPYDAASLSRWDPAAGQHRDVCAVGYPEPVLRFLTDRFHADPLFEIPRRTGQPVRVRDLPRRRRGGPVFDEVIAPCGFREGLTLCLYAASGRYAGMLNLSTQSPRHPDDEATALLGLLATDLAGTLDPDPGRRDASGSPVRTLSPREREVLALIARGLSNAEIAQALHVMPRTVATHVEHLLAKLDVPNRAAAAARLAGGDAVG